MLFTRHNSQRGLSNGGCLGKFTFTVSGKLRPSMNVIIIVKSFYVFVYFIGGLKIGLRYRSSQKCSFFDTSLCEEHSERSSESQIQKNSNK